MKVRLTTTFTTADDVDVSFEMLDAVAAAVKQAVADFKAPAAVFTDKGDPSPEPFLTQLAYQVSTSVETKAYVNA